MISNRILWVKLTVNPIISVEVIWPQTFLCENSRVISKQSDFKKLKNFHKKTQGLTSHVKINWCQEELVDMQETGLTDYLIN